MSDIVFDLPDEKKKAPAAASAAAAAPASESDITFELPPEEPLALTALKKGWKYTTGALGAANNAKNYVAAKVLGLSKPGDSPLNAPSFNQMADRAGEVPGLSQMQRLNEKIFGKTVAGATKKGSLFLADALTDPLTWGAPALKAVGMSKLAVPFEYASGDRLAKWAGTKMYGAGANPAIERMMAENPNMTREQALEFLVAERIKGSRPNQLKQVQAASDAIQQKHIGIPKALTEAGQMISEENVALIVQELRAKANAFQAAGGGQNWSRSQELNSIANALEGKAWAPDAFEKTARNYRGLQYGDPELIKARNILTSRMRGAMDIAAKEGVNAGAVPLEEGMDYLKNRAHQSKLISAERGLEADIAGQKNVWEQMGNRALNAPFVTPQTAAVRAAGTVTKSALPWMGTNFGMFLKKYPKVLSSPVRQPLYSGYEDPEQKLLDELKLE